MDNALTVSPEIQDTVTSFAFQVARKRKNKAMSKRDAGKATLRKIKDKKARRTFGEQQIVLEQETLSAIQAFNDMQNPLSDRVRREEEKKIASDIQSGTHAEYQGDTLGNSYKTKHVASGSYEWLEQRKRGIGGSDLAKILRLDTYSHSPYREILTDKLSPVDDELLSQQNVPNSAAWRGNNWEDAMLREFNSRHPEFNVIHCKDSWASREDDRFFANCDGLISVNGEVQGILEIKTTNRPDQWDNGVPLKYMAQVLWYLGVFDFDFAYVAVMIDSSEYRDYYVSKTEQIPVFSKNKTVMMGIDELKQEVRTFLEEVDSGKKLISEGASVSEALSKFNPKRGEVKSITPAKEKMFSAVAQYNAHIEKPEDLIPAYYSINPETWTRNIVSVDLETTRFSATSGYIIEFGAVEYDKQGNVVSTINELFDIPADMREKHGTGSEDIHGITLKEIEGKPTFQESNARIMDFLRGKVLLAHNAMFELSWMNQHLDGFIDENMPVIDTMKLSTLLLPNATDSRLETMCAELGVDYTNGHRAYHDALVAGDAFFALVKKLTQ